MNKGSIRQQFHLISLFGDPIPVLGTGRFVLAMFDHGEDLIQYTPPEVLRANLPITLSARVWDDGPKLWDEAPKLWADLPIVWAEQLCRAVCFIHRHRMIHRDISQITSPSTREHTNSPSSTSALRWRDREGAHLS